MAMWQRPATLPHVLDDPVERALAAAQRAHPVVRVVVAVERDLDAVQPEGQQPIDDLFGEQQAVGDDVDPHVRRRAAGVARHMRSASSYMTGRFSSGSPPKNVSISFSGCWRSISRSIQSPTRPAVSSDILSANLL